jgi:uncharacterized membrane protein
LRKIITGGITAALALSAAFAVGSLAGTSTGQGAQKSTLSTTMGSSSDCNAGSGADSSGFAILNAPGNPHVAVDRVVGEVSAKRLAPNHTYQVDLAIDSTCMPQGTLSTNTVGNGNFHIDLPVSPGDTYFVVVREPMGNEIVASQPVPLQ